MSRADFDFNFEGELPSVIGNESFPENEDLVPSKLRDRRAAFGESTMKVFPEKGGYGRRDLVFSNRRNRSSLAEGRRVWSHNRDPIALSSIDQLPVVFPAFLSAAPTVIGG